MKNYTEEYVDICGLRTYMITFPAPEAQTKPVLLFLHGGPGESMAPFMHGLARGLAGACTLIAYDQRGAGRTLLADVSKYADMPLMQQELSGVLKLIRSRYPGSKLCVLGHSWGSVLGSLEALLHPEELDCYIGVGQVVDMVENEAVGFATLKARIEDRGCAKDLQRLAAIGEYPGKEGEYMMEKIPSVRKLQQKYGLAMKIDAKLIRLFMGAPSFKLCDLKAMKLSMQANRTLDGPLTRFSLYPYSREYRVPVYYVLGDRDHQTPYTVGAKYLESIAAPDKQLYLIKDAGHMTPTDNPAEFAAALRDIMTKPDCIQYCD